MAHHETTEHLSPQEKKYRALMTNGDDFMKIEIYRSALKRYQDAAALGIDDGLASRKIAECKQLLKKENRAIYIILAIAAVAVVLIWLL